MSSRRRKNPTETADTIVTASVKIVEDALLFTKKGSMFTPASDGSILIQQLLDPLKQEYLRRSQNGQDARDYLADPNVPVSERAQLLALAERSSKDPVAAARAYVDAKEWGYHRYIARILSTIWENATTNLLIEQDILEMIDQEHQDGVKLIIELLKLSVQNESEAITKLRAYTRHAAQSGDAKRN